VKVQYELTPEDLVEFAMLSLRRPAVARAIRMRQFGVVMLFGAMGIGFTFLDGLGRLPAFVVVGGMLFALVLPSLWAAQARRQVAASYADGRNRALYAVHEMMLTPEALIVASEFKETRLRWRGIEEIGETENLFLIDESSVMGYVVPRRPFESGGAADGFLKAARAHRARACSGMLPEAPSPQGGAEV